MSSKKISKLMQTREYVLDLKGLARGSEDGERLIPFKEGPFPDGPFSEVMRHGSLFLISDIHLNDEKIIGYCKRPFANVREMDEAILDNWNETVKGKDVVYYVGDITYGRGQFAHQWLRKLNGNMAYVLGNHDDNVQFILPTFSYMEIRPDADHTFMLVHDPRRVPHKYHGWVIHGHKHNKDVCGYPFINGEKKTINVSAELLDYRPLNMEYLLSLDIDTIRRMDTIHSMPIRF